MATNDITEFSTYELWNEARQFSLTMERIDPTTLRLTWVLPTGTRTIDGYVIVMSDRTLSPASFPVDGQRYNGSSNWQLPVDTIGGAHVVYSAHKILGDNISAVTSIDITNLDANTIYYASLHGASNVLQYYPAGIQSYPIEASQIARRIEAYTGNIPTSQTPPLNPQLGQTYYEPQTNTVFIWNGAAWSPLQQGTYIVDNVFPTAPTVGFMFYYLNTERLYVFDPTVPVIPGSGVPAGWSHVNTFQEGVATYDKLHVGTDGTYDARVRLMSILKAQMGWPKVCVELTEEHFNIGIDNAIEYLRMRAASGYEKRYILLTLVPFQQTYYLNDPRDKTDRVIDIMGIFRVNRLGVTAVTQENIIYAQAFYNQFFYGPFVDILSLHLVNNLSEEFERIFAGNYTHSWDEPSRQLVLLRRVNFPEKVVLSCVMERTEQDLLNDRYVKQWLQDWAHAELKHMLGMIRTKYGTLPGAGGGITLNGDTLLAEAIADFEELRRQVNDYEIANAGHQFENCAMLIG